MWDSLESLTLMTCIIVIHISFAIIRYHYKYYEKSVSFSQKTCEDFAMTFNRIEYLVLLLFSSDFFSCFFFAIRCLLFEWLAIKCSSQNTSLWAWKWYLQWNRLLESELTVNCNPFNLSKHVLDNSKFDAFLSM